jgi:hypothetical protein
MRVPVPLHLHLLIMTIQTIGRDATVIKFVTESNRFGAGLEIPKSGRCRCKHCPTVAEITRLRLRLHSPADALILLLGR